VLRSTTRAPSRRCGAIWSTVRSKTVIDGLRNSSTGVPMTTTTVFVRPRIEASALRERRPVGRISASSASAPFSRNGISPRPICSRVRSLVSYMPTRTPTRAKTRLRGRPTWPPPPRTTTSSGVADSDRVSITVCTLSLRRPDAAHPGARQPGRPAAQLMAHPANLSGAAEGAGLVHPGQPTGGLARLRCVSRPCRARYALTATSPSASRWRTRQAAEPSIAASRLG
jgi:hypothetical protein